MKTKLRHRKTGERGMALIVALLFITTSAMVITTLTVRMLNQRVTVGHYETYQNTFHGLEAAIAQAKVELDTDGSSVIGLDGWTPEYDNGNRLVFPDFHDGDVTPVTLPEAPDIEFVALALHWGDDGRDSNGDGVVDSIAEQGMYTIYAAAQKDNLVRRAEVVYQARDFNVWNNAIFAGGGMAGGLINGNVSIHGSVHLLGENLIYGAPAIAAIDLSGTSIIRNNYQDIPNQLRQRVPPLPMVMLDGEMVETLETELRVKNGLVAMSGNAHVGSPNSPGNGMKDTILGTFVTDGWAGNSVTPDGDRGTPTQVHSDNGWSELYDLGDHVPFPLLSDDWREPDGERVHNPDTGAWFTHEDFFSEVLLADPAVKDDGIYDGDIELFTRGDHFYWNSTQEIELNNLPSTAPNPTDDYILFNSDTNVLEINGQIRINGDLRFRGQGSDRTIHYSGRAAILVDGDVEISTNLYTANNGNPGDTANSFPENNVMGLMATGNMMVGGASQLDIMGAFYAQGAISTQRQTNVMGTFVASYFDMGTNVPSIYQVPELANHLPYGMIANYPLMVMNQISWRELGI